MWAIAPLAFGLPAPACFAFAAWRLRSRRLGLEALGYAGALALGIALSGAHGGAGAVSAALVWAVALLATGHALVIRKRVFPPRRATQSPADPPAGHPAPYDPAAFPAGAAAPDDPASPASWVRSLRCDGRDQHDVGLSPRHAALFVIPGAGWIAACAWLHVYGRPLGVGVGMMALPLLSWLFRRQLDGPVLRYRNWGAQHTFRLDTATAVRLAPRTAATLVLDGPDAPRRGVRVGLRGSPDTSAREHLKGWLARPGVQVDLRAAAVLADQLAGATPARRRRLRWIRLAALALTLAGFAIALVVRLVAPPLALTAAACLQAAPKGASPAARAYLAAADAGYAGWSEVTSDAHAHGGRLDRADLLVQGQTDFTFLTRLRAIDFPEPARAPAQQLESALSGYLRILALTVTSQPGLLASDEQLVGRLDAQRGSASANLRRALGLPQSRCLVDRP